MSLKTEVRKSKTKRFHGAVRGVLAAIGGEGEALVDFCGNDSQPVAAISTISATQHDIGREAILLFEDGDPSRPILIGLVQAPEAASVDESEVNVMVDGRRLVFSAKEEISITCGEASITLTKAGKVLIKGAYLLSKSTGTNRIKGGSVELN